MIESLRISKRRRVQVFVFFYIEFGVKISEVDMGRAAAPAGLHPRERLHPARRLRGHFRRHQTAEEDESLLGAAPQDPRPAGLAGPGESGLPGAGPPACLLPYC
jgi:hypothetical protein